MKKRVLSLLLTLSMVFTLLPTVSLPALAAGDTSGDGYTFTDSTKTLDITTNAGLEGWLGIANTIVTVNIGDSVLGAIAPSTFDDCTALNAFTVGSSNTAYKSDGGVLFTKDGTKLLRYPLAKADPKAYAVPDTVTEIETLAFYQCAALHELTFPESVTKVGQNALFLFTGLTKVSIPASLTSFDFSGAPPFYGSTALPEITVDANNTAYKSVGGVLFNKTGTTLLKYPEGKTDTTYTIPNETTTINARAMESIQNLTEVIIHNGVTTMGHTAFSECPQLQTVDLGTALEAINGSTFRGCVVLKNITIPSTVTTINERAFFNCPKLKTVIMKPTTAPTLGQYQFANSIPQVVYYPTGATGYTAGGWANADVQARLVPGAAALAGLSISEGTLNPAFTPANETYTATVADNIPSLTVTPTNGNVETITVNGTPVTSENASGAITLNDGDNTITVVATDETTHDTKTYTITVTKGNGSTPVSWNGNWAGLAAGIGFNYGSTNHLRVTMPTTNNYYTYGKITGGTVSNGTVTGGTVSQTKVNQASLPSDWNWNVQYHTTPVNGANYTLTLKDAVWTTDFADGDSLMTSNHLNLVLEGTNSVASTASNLSAVSANSDINLTIQGSGNLNATAGDAAICCLASLTLDCSGTITAHGIDRAGIVGYSKIDIKQGTVIGSSDTKQAFEAAPVLTNYLNHSLSVSTNKDGTSPTIYDAAKIGTYKYFKVKPGVQHTVTFNYQSGTGSPTNAKTEYMGNLSSLPTPTRDGYYFTGWFTAAIGGDEVTTAAVFTGNTTIYAQWTKKYTITFNTNGGTTVDPIVTGPNGKLSSSPATPTKVDYNFAGWFTELNGGGTPVNTTTATFAANTTIYAHWTAKPVHTITFDYQGGTGSPANAVTQPDGKLASMPADPTKAGFNFSGWFTETNGGGTPVNTDTFFAVNTTIYAHWIAVPPISGGYVPPKKPVIVDDKTVNIGTEKKSGSTTTLTPDQKRLTDEIGKAKEAGTVLVPISENTTAVARLAVKNVEDMAAKNMTLSVETGGVRYDLPADAMDLKAMSDAFPGVDTAKIPFDVTIGNSDVTVKDTAVVLNPTEFTVTATSGGKTVAADRFSVFVDRTFEVTKAQSEKITTAVVVEPDGTLRHVPTFVYEKGGKYYAVVKSMTNSVYSLIQNDVTFPDAKGKWYEDVAHEVGSRKIVMGTDKGAFGGDEKITRAEFAAMMVRGLGLPQGKTSAFTDVPADAWYAGSVATATEYGIVSGVGDQKFNPTGLITREEAYQMLYTAAKRTGFPTPLDPRNLSGELSDLTAVSDWAQTAVTWCLNQNLTVNLDGAIRPNEEITRGEMSALILKLLQRSELVDVRTKL